PISGIRGKQIQAALGRNDFALKSATSNKRVCLPQKLQDQRSLAAVVNERSIEGNFRGELKSDRCRKMHTADCHNNNRVFEIYQSRRYLVRASPENSHSHVKCGNYDVEAGMRWECLRSKCHAGNLDDIAR